MDPRTRRKIHLKLDPGKALYTLAESVELTATAYEPPTPKPTHARLSDGSVMPVGGSVTPHESLLRIHTVVLHELIDAGKVSPRSLRSGADVSTMGIKLRPGSKEDAERYALTAEDFSKFCAAVLITTTDAQTSKAVGTPESATPSAPWKKVARQIGEDWMRQQEKETRMRPTVKTVADYVEGELSNRDVKGARGKFLDSETIAREALTGITGRKRGENLRK